MEAPTKSTDRVAKSVTPTVAEEGLSGPEPQTEAHRGG